MVYYVFDVMILAGTDVTNRSLDERRRLLEQKVLPKLTEPVRYAAPLDATLPVLIESVKSHGLEGLVAKRRDGRYEPGLRSGAWMKMRVDQRPGIRDWRLHTRNHDLRRAGVRLLREQRAHVRLQDTQRLHTRHSRGSVQEVQRPRDRPSARS